MRSARSVRLTAILALAVDPFGLARGGEPRTKTLYEQARQAQGRSYVEARDAFLAHGAAASDELKRQATSATDPTDRWEAEALLARLKDPDEFVKLGKVFAGRVGHLRSGFPMRKATGEPIVRLDAYSGLLLPEELSPLAHPKERHHFLPPDDEVKFVDSLRITDAPLWPAVLAEIFLKGWAAADPSMSAPPKQTKRRPFDELNSFVGPPAREDYTMQAMLLLAKLGENRIVPKATAILKSPAFTSQDRATAAKALSLVKEPTALAPLLELVTDDSLSPRLQQQIFVAIGRKKDPKAIPVLDQIIATAPKVRAASEAGWGPWFRGSQAKQTREEILAPTPGAKGHTAPGLR